MHVLTKPLTTWLSAVALTTLTLALFSTPSYAAKAGPAWCNSVAEIQALNGRVAPTTVKYTSKAEALSSISSSTDFLNKELGVAKKAYEHAPTKKLRVLYTAVYSVLSARYNSIANEVHALSALSSASSSAKVTATVAKVAHEGQVAEQDALAPLITIIKNGDAPLTKACGPGAARDLQNLQ